MKGKIFLLMGPSGSGKNTVLKDVLTEIPDMIMPRGVWTRPYRGNPQEEDSDTISRGQFEVMCLDGELTGVGKFAGNWYGVPKENIQIPLDKGWSVIRIVTVQGVEDIKKDFPNNKVVTIFLDCPVEVLTRRLFQRGDLWTDIDRRMEAADDELATAFDWDYRVDASKSSNVVKWNVRCIINKEQTHER